MKSLRQRRGRILAALVLGVLSVAPAGLAQSPSPSPTATPTARAARLEASLVDFPVSVGPADSLTVALEVSNTGNAPAPDLEVAITIYQGVTSRSRLHQTYEGRLGTTVAVDTFPVDGALAPGETRRIEVAKPLGELGSFRNSTQDRAYPVRVIVRSGRVAADPVTTHMVFFHEQPERPLRIGLLIPLHSPSIYTDGSKPDLVTSGSLERSITEGRLARILGALEAHPDLPVTLAPSGLLLSMLADMADGYPRSTSAGPQDVPPTDPLAEAAGRTLARIQNLAARPNTRIITTTYSPASLPALFRNGLQELAATQLAEGHNVLLSEPLGLLRSQPLDGWLLPAFGALDQASLIQLNRTQYHRFVVSSSSLTPTDSPFTPAQLLRLEGGSGSATEGLAGVETIALVADDGLARQIERSGEIGSIEARQRIAAESATIHLETPGVERGLMAVAPPDWEAHRNSAADLLDVAETASWLQVTTPDAIVGELEGAGGERARLAGSSAVLDIGPNLPPDSYFAALADARLAISRFSALSPPPDRIGKLSRRLLIAESTDWWSSRGALSQGLSFAEAIPPSIAAEMRKVRAPASQTITLTSRTGVIPLSVGSGLGYPVDVVMRLESDKLRFPDGNRVQIADLQPPNQTIRVRAITQSSGTFPLNVQLFTPDGTLISSSQLTIRSTAYNVVALSITAAAGIFLVGWWLVGLVRRRLTRSGDTPDPGGEAPGREAEPEDPEAAGDPARAAVPAGEGPGEPGTSEPPPETG